MTIFIFDKSSSVLSAGLSFVINNNYPQAKVIRSTSINSANAISEPIDLLVLFQEQGMPVIAKEWIAIKEYCGNPPCFALLEAPTFKSLKTLLCAFPIKLMACINEANDELIKTIIDNLDSGGIFFSKSVTLMLHDYLCKCDDDDEANIALTRREAQVLDLVRKGKGAPDIAQEMGLSINTVQVFLAKLRKKYKVRNTLSLISKST